MQALKVMLRVKKFSKNVHGQDLNLHNCGFWFRSRLYYQLSQTLHSLIAVLAYTGAFSALVRMSYHTCRLLKYTSPSQKTQLSFRASLVSIDADTAEISTGRSRQTDRWLSFYILDKMQEP